MKYLKCYLISILLYSLAIAQIPNPGFENWTRDGVNNLNPDGWQVPSNGGNFYTTILRSEQSRSGSYSMRGELTKYKTFLVGPRVYTGFAVNNRPESLTGYYQFNPIGSDTLLINVKFYYKMNNVASASLPISQAKSLFVQFDVKINYLTTVIPDSCNIEFTIKNKASAFPNIGNLGTYFLIDDLNFVNTSTAVKLENNNLQLFMLHQNYPNPFNPTTTFEYEIFHPQNVIINIYDVAGRLVKELVNENKNTGKYAAIWDSRDNFGSVVASGNYFYQIKSGDFVQVKKMILLK